MAEENEPDEVRRPRHYRAGDIECIDGIRAALGDGFASYCQGNVLKYVWRHRYKGHPVQDLEKAKWYLERLIDEQGR